MVIMKMSQIMVDAYAEVREGDMRPLKMLTGRGWKFYTCLLTHETMTIYRSTKVFNNDFFSFLLLMFTAVYFTENVRQGYYISKNRQRSVRSVRQ